MFFKNRNNDFLNCEIIKGSLIEVDHIVAFHKLEVGDLLYFGNKKIVPIEITDKNGKSIIVLSVEKKGE